MCFSKKVVLITGGGSGIGAEAARQFAKQGALLALAARNESNLNKVAAECEVLSPEKVKPLVLVADVNKKEDVENIIKSTVQLYGRLDVLVNSAGIFTSGSIQNSSLKEYDDTMDTNLRSVYHLIMLTTPHLIESHGNIVNVSSIMGNNSSAFFLAYGTSKAAMNHLTKSLAVELGPKGVRVNAVSPGTIDTGIHLKSVMSEEEYKEYQTSARSVHALNRIGLPHEVASVILFLAGEGASFVTGAILPVDGGRHAMAVAVKN